MLIEEGSEKNKKEQIANFFINSHILIHVSSKVTQLLTGKHIDLSNVGGQCTVKVHQISTFPITRLTGSCDRVIIQTTQAIRQPTA